MVEGGDLVDLGHRHLHLSRERDQMRGRQAAEAILNLVQVLDQQVATAWRVTEQGLHLRPCRGIDGAPFGLSAHAGALAPRWGVQGRGG